MNTTNLLSIQTAKGTVKHLVRQGEQHTLCGRHHGTNVRYVKVGMPNVEDSDKATCPTCKKAG